jgi:hypothetical protein
MQCFQNYTSSVILTHPDPEYKLRLAIIQADITFEQVHHAPKLFQNCQTKEGKETMHRVLLAILKLFQDSTHVTRGMDGAELFECSRMMLNKYTHESIEDFLLAFKRVKLQGRKFYNSFSQADVFDIINEYMEAKHQFLAQHYRIQYTDYEKGRNHNATRNIENPNMEEVYEKFKKTGVQEKQKLQSEYTRLMQIEKAKQMINDFQEMLTYQDEVSDQPNPQTQEQ